MARSLVRSLTQEPFLCCSRDSQQYGEYKCRRPPDANEFRRYQYRYLYTDPKRFYGSVLPTNVTIGGGETFLLGGNNFCTITSTGNLAFNATGPVTLLADQVQARLERRRSLEMEPPRLQAAPFHSQALQRRSGFYHNVDRRPDRPGIRCSQSLRQCPHLAVGEWEFNRERPRRRFSWIIWPSSKILEAAAPQ